MDLRDLKDLTIHNVQPTEDSQYPSEGAELDMPFARLGGE